MGFQIHGSRNLKFTEVERYGNQDTRLQHNGAIVLSYTIAIESSCSWYFGLNIPNFIGVCSTKYRLEIIDNSLSIGLRDGSYLFISFCISLTS